MSLATGVAGRQSVTTAAALNGGTDSYVEEVAVQASYDNTATIQIGFGASSIGYELQAGDPIVFSGDDKQLVNIAGIWAKATSGTQTVTWFGRKRRSQL